MVQKLGAADHRSRSRLSRSREPSGTCAARSRSASLSFYTSRSKRAVSPAPEGHLRVARQFTAGRPIAQYRAISPAGTAERRRIQPSPRDGRASELPMYPALNCWVIIERRYATIGGDLCGEVSLGKRDLPVVARIGSRPLFPRASFDRPQVPMPVAEIRG